MAANHAVADPGLESTPTVPVGRVPERGLCGVGTVSVCGKQDHGLSLGIHCTASAITFLPSVPSLEILTEPERPARKRKVRACGTGVRAGETLAG